MVIKSRYEWLDILNHLQLNLSRQIDSLLNIKKQQLDLNYAHLKALNPISQLKNRKEKIEQLEQKLQQALLRRFAELKWRLDLYKSKLNQLKIEIKPYLEQLSYQQLRLNRALNLLIKQQQQQLNGLEQALILLSPQNVLKRGYAIISDNKGKIIQKANQVRHHARINIRLSDGEVSAIIDKQHNAYQEELI